MTSKSQDGGNVVVLSVVRMRKSLRICTQKDCKYKVVAVGNAHTASIEAFTCKLCSKDDDI